MNPSLKDKVAFVTGGSRGIGAAIVRRLAKEGAAVVLTYVSSPDKANQIVQEIEADGGRALALAVDAADPEATRAAVAKAADVFGRIDVLVNNAGTLMIGSVTEFSVADFDKIVALNVRSAFVATQETAKYMGAGGRIINIGSMAGDRSTFPGSAFYSMSKAAIAAMTRGFAIDLAPKGITVNNLQPGPTQTDMNPSEGDHVEPLKGMIPLRRFGTPDEIANFVAFLASSESSFVTGASLTIDGGLTA